jgi:hypothetical protein
VGVDAPRTGTAVLLAAGDEGLKNGVELTTDLKFYTILWIFKLNFIV